MNSPRDRADQADPAGVRDRIDQTMHDALQETGTPGAVLLVRLRGELVVSRAWGAARILDVRGRPCSPTPMRVDTTFDIASITKVVATTALAMTSVGAGELNLDQPVATILPHFTGGGREGVTVRHLLTHRSGLPDWAPLFQLASDAEQATAALCQVPLSAPPGTTTRYSDLGMMLLGRCLERVTRTPLATLAGQRIFAPLGMDATGYGPRTDEAANCAATSFANPVEARMLAQRGYDVLERSSWWRERTLCGEANDANAAVAFGGVAGHAGLFATAEDLGRFGEALLRAATDPRDASAEHLWPAHLVRDFFTPRSDPTQGLGFWTRRVTTVLGTDAGIDPATDTSVGHRGFTGCELLVDPARDLVVVLLSNRLHGTDPPPSHTPLWTAALRAVLAGTSRSGP